jgi:hypothetical protein
MFPKTVPRPPVQKEVDQVSKIAIGTGGLFLVSVVVIAVHVLLLAAIAGIEKGGSPFTAISLADQKNAGTLAPGQTRWYQFVEEGNGGALQRQMDLTLIFTPDDGRRIHHVNFQIFPSEQATRWYWRDAGQMQRLGAGGIVSRDGNPTTGELLWGGWISDNETYYVQVFNGADVSIPELVGLPSAGVVSDHSPPTGLEKGQLPAGGEMWYAVIYEDYDDEVYEAHTLTLVFTPGGGDRVHHVGFEIFPDDQLPTWQPENTQQLRRVGAAGAVSRDDDPNTGELSWSGGLVDGKTYYIRLHNEAEVAVDYWFFMADTFSSEPGDLIRQ